ncbi:MAG: hypothetical protein MOGMAGMI_00183 [Candidatus Omnitrophica bacterium]|nr:hypothetical protein [Candidatus Omnitrophota bacterium]
MTRSAFEKAVREAARGLPKVFRDRIHNVEIIVESRSPDGELTGLYEGVPLTERGADRSAELPDRIILYQKDIEEDCRENGSDLREHIAHVLRHEIAHYFGISDERLEDLGAY